MQVQVESCARDLRRTKDGREYTGIKVNGEWINVMGDHRDAYKKQLDLDIRGKWAEVIKPAETPAARGAAPPANGHSGAATLEDLKTFMFEAHKIAVMLEGDSTDQQPDSNPVYFDRAQARAAIVNTLVIAFTNGKISLPDGPPPPDDSDNIPF